MNVAAAAADHSGKPFRNADSLLFPLYRLALPAQGCWDGGMDGGDY